jgi:hypothetical protein
MKSRTAAMTAPATSPQNGNHRRNDAMDSPGFCAAAHVQAAEQHRGGGLVLHAVQCLQQVLVSCKGSAI